MHQNVVRPSVDLDRPNVPPRLSEMCRQMMAHSPGERPQMADEVARQLAAL